MTDFPIIWATITNIHLTYNRLFNEKQTCLMKGLNHRRQSQQMSQNQPSNNEYLIA